jgi:hypothetical protein
MGPIGSRLGGDILPLKILQASGAPAGGIHTHFLHKTPVLLILRML